MPRAILFVFVFFILELIVLIQIGSRIGALTTISIMFIMMLIGGLLIKLRFRQVMMSMRQDPHTSLALLCLPIAGFLFIFPGFISDILGLLILLPPIQRLLQGRFKTTGQTFQGFTYFHSDFPNQDKSRSGTIVEGEFTEIKEEKGLLKHSSNEDNSSAKK